MNRPLSLRARLLKWTTRHIIRRAFSAQMPPARKRLLLERLVRPLSRPARGSRCVPDVLGGVAMEWMEMTGANARGTFIYLHGGAYVVGSPRLYRDLTSRLARSCRLRVAALDYRLAPEHPHPAAVEDALSAYRALLAQGTSAARIIIGGDSAGGGLTLACALAIRDAGLPQPAGLVLLSPWTDLSLSGRSVHEKQANDILLRPASLAQAALAYLGKHSAQTPLASPLFADLHELPPLHIQATDCEILLDDATRLHAKVQAAGGRSELHVFPGLWHVFQMFAGKMPEADTALTHIQRFTDRSIPA